MNTTPFNIFTDKQIEAIKDIIKAGFWGDSNIIFGNNSITNYALGYSTNLKKGKEFSGICSGIKKIIISTHSEAIKMISDFWNDGNSGDMMFFNLDLLDCDSKGLNKWANN